MEPRKLKGRGAQKNVPNRFEKLVREYDPELEEDADEKTKFIPTYPKTIINKVPSPDIPLDYSMNPYQGCEHGCVYCYARTTHAFWGYSPGLDFERVILVKQNAPVLLEKELKKKNWKVAPIMLSGNTDCYQPAEKQFEITRRLLEVLWKYRHPVGIITKNSLILRDLDLLERMGKERLVQVAISITTLDENLRRVLEPRTATIANRYRTVEVLSQAGIPVNAMLSPIIPGLTDHEVMAMAKLAAEKGAKRLNYSMVRLNGEVGEIFTDWVRRFFPDRADKVLHHIEDTHGGTLEESRIGKRMRGEGKIAEMVRQQIMLARKLYFPESENLDYNLELYEQFKNPQMRLF